MKLINSLCTALGLLLLLPASAQEVPTIDTLLDRFQGNHMGSLLEVFTYNELQTIKDYQLANTLVYNQESSVLLNRRIGTTDAVTPVSVVTINPNNLNDIPNFGPSSLNEFEGSGYIRGVGSPNAIIIDNSGRKYRRPIESNIYEDRGLLIGLPPGETLTGVEVLSNGPMDIFGITTNGVNSSHLVKLDPDSETVTVIGDNNGLILPIALGRDGANNLITLDIDNDAVYGVDVTSGVVSMIGSVGYNADFGMGMTYDDASSQLLITGYNMAVGDSELRIVNTTTGNSTAVGIIDMGHVSQYGWANAFDRDLLNVPSQGLESFKYYPNPSQDMLHFESTIIIDELSIYNMHGQKVLQFFPKTLLGELQISTLSAGIYILKVNLNETISSQKLIKR